MNYNDFIARKSVTDIPTGILVESVNSQLYDFQRDIVIWALKRGRACIFADCGMGKTPIQLSWADEIRKRKKSDILIITPLAVAAQTVKEGEKFNIKAEYRRDGKKSDCGITITNYEMYHHFNPDDYTGVVLDESSILKSYTGKFRNDLIQSFVKTPFKLCCTATPAPNDMMELGNHSEFMGVMSRLEMLSMFFVHDGGETQNWRLKGHAKDDYWKWICSWAIMLRKPSDLGYEDDGFVLPAFNLHEIVTEADDSLVKDTLFAMEAKTLSERQQARRTTVEERCKKAAEIVNGSDDFWLIWCDRNIESEMLKKLIGGSVEIKGSDNHKHKEESMLGFSAGKIKRLITKPSIAGFGMNWQHCKNIIFVGLSDSYEQFYQAARRVWRFGQKRPVDCYIITSSIEGAVVANIKRKEKQAVELAAGMISNMHVYNEQNIKGVTKNITKYEPKITMRIPNWLKGA